MAYTAVNSLIQTLELLRTTYPALIHGQAAEMVDSLLATAHYFQKILENASHQKHEYEKIEDFKEEMKAAVQQGEDQLESNVVEIMRERYNNNTIQDEAGVLLRDMPRAIDKIDTVKKDLEQVIESSAFSHAYDTGSSGNRFFKKGDALSRKRASTIQEVIVGLDDALMKITDRLLGSASEREVVTIMGMGGCGKTTLARKAQDDPSIKSRFDIRAWVTISQEYHLGEVLLSLVNSITRNKIHDMNEDELMEKAYRELKGHRYLIVVDDVWSTDIWDVLARTLPDDENGSRIILTTRLKHVAEYVNSHIPPHEMTPLSLDESWELLCNNLFETEYNCSPGFEDIGKEIVEKCQGLPLAILVVAGHLSRVPMTQESWETVAKNVSKVVNSYPDKCLAILAMSYYHLPIHLKPCFLHMATFPEDVEISVWRLIRCWVAEGFLRSDRLKYPEDVAEECLEDLISRNLLMVRRRKYDGRIKSCGMHDLLRDLSVSEAEKENFLNVIRIPLNFPVKIHGTHRYSWHTPISLENSSQSSQVMRSLYLWDRPDKPIAETSEFKALRVLAVDYNHDTSFQHRMTLDSTILRYLQVVTHNHFTEFLTYMYNLQTFIYRNSELEGHKVITVPNQIWNMKQLRHLHVDHSVYLPNPQGVSSSDLGLQHLQEVSSLCFASCTKEVLSCLTNLKKLKVDNIGRTMKGLEGTSGSLTNLLYLNKLENLVMSVCVPSSPFGDCCPFPVSLKRLTIDHGLLPWEDIATLTKLHNLEVLKLKFDAFYGKIWKLNDEDQFNQLKLLLLAHVYLKHWEASSVSFPNLRRLIFQDICTLDRIPLDFAEICTLESIELYNCDPYLGISAVEIQEEVASMAGNDCLRVDIYDEYNDYIKDKGV